MLTAISRIARWASRERAAKGGIHMSIKTAAPGISAALALGALVFPGLGNAQSAPEPGAISSPSGPPASAAAATPPDQNASGGDVLVTALKKSETVQRVPASVTALTGASLQQRGITNINQLQFSVPSLTSGSILGTTQITIRGIGPGPGGPSVAVYVDGVYQPIAATADLAQTDLARVEVLRGPQGTLYGRNANGGAVNFISNAPTDQFGGYILGDAESYGEYKVQGVINIPLGPNIRSRLAMNYDDRLDGFIKNIIPGQEDLDKGQIFSTRLRVDADLSSDVTLDVNLQDQHREGPFQYFTLHNVPNATGVALNPYLVNAIVPLTPFKTSANGPSGTNENFALAAGTLTWHSPIGEFKSITAYQYYGINEHTDQDSTQLSAFNNHNTNYDNTFSEEVNLSSKIGPVDSILGAFYTDERASTRTFYSFPLGISPLPPKSYLQYFTPKHDTNTVAGYIDLTWNVTDRFRLIGGARYSDDRQIYVVSNQFGTTALGPLTPFAILCNKRTTNLDFGSFTGRAGAQFDIDRNQNVYGTVSTGYLAGGLNTSVCPTHNVYNPETITAYELGYKSQLFDGKVTFDASGFYYEYTNLQVAQTVNLAALTTNAAAATVKGLEFEGDWVPNRHWTVNATLSLLDAQYDKFLSTDSLFPALGAQNVAGHYLNNSPKVSVNGGVAYRTDKYNWGELVARVDVSYRSLIYFREFNLPLDSQAPYTLVNLNLIWTDPSDRYSIRAFGTNVTNVGYITTLGTSNNFGSRYITWGDPAQYGVEVKAKF